MENKEIKMSDLLDQLVHDQTFLGSQEERETFCFGFLHMLIEI